MDDIYQITITPVLTNAIRFLLKSYDETLENFRRFGPPFDKNTMAFFGHPSSLEDVYTQDPPKDESIRKAREILSFWREQPQPTFGYADFYEDNEPIQEMFSKLTVRNRSNNKLRSRYFHQYKSILTSVYNYLNALGVETPGETLHLQLVHLFGHFETRIDTLNKESPDYRNDFMDLINANKNRWTDQTKEMNANCEMWRIEVNYRGIPYGGIMVYHNDKYKLHGEKYLFIQNIAMYPIPYFVKLMYPDLPLPKLNSLLNDPINRLGNETKSKYVTVHPLPRQGYILETYYSYKVEHSYVLLPGTSIAETYESRPRLSKLIE